MKKYILFLIIVLLSNLAIGQSIVDTTKMWRTKIMGTPCNGDTASETRTQTIKFGEDTMINYIQYRKVYRATDEFYTNWSLYLFMREDTNQRIYFRSDTSLQEYLLYNFNANIDDTLTVSGVFVNVNNDYSFGTNQMVVDSIDTIFFAGQNRKRISLGCQYSNEEHWIEGIGNIEHGILNNNMGFINSTDLNLLCVYQLDTLIYSYGGNCYQYYECPNNITEQQNNKIEIYPNPSNGNFLIELPENIESAQLTIFTITGQIIKVIPLNKGQTTYQFTEKLPAGIYFVGVDSEKGTVVKKLIVN